MQNRAPGRLARLAGCALAALVTPVGAQSPATISITPPNAGLSLVHGSLPEDHTGVGISGGGDFNGDGHPDVLVGGVLLQDAAGAQTGAACVVYGGPSAGATTWLGPSGAGSVYLVGPSLGDAAGWAVAFAGDVNDDGFDDIVVGAFSTDVAGASDAGVAYLILGGPVPNGTYPLLAPPTGVSVLVGTSANDRVGFAVAGAGDVNGDAFDDFLVGAPLADGAGLTDGGCVYLVYGAPTLPPILSTAALGSNGVTLLPEVPFGAAGFAVAGAGDTNGDGFDDLLVGAPTIMSAGVYAGRAYLVSGGANLPPSISLGSSTAVFLGPPEDALGGRAISGAGDVDGDGYDDVLVGAPYYDPLSRADAGSAFLLLGGPLLSGAIALPGGAETVFLGASSLDRAGQALAPAGDANGDGIPDLLVGSPYCDSPGGADEGRAYLVLGQRPMPPVIDFASPGRSTIVLQGTEPGGILGFALCGLGDLDGDGFGDVAACAPYADPGGAFNAGTTGLFFGGPTPIVLAPGCAGAAPAAPQAWFTGDFPRAGGSKFALTLGGATPSGLAAVGIGVPLPPSWPGIPLDLFGLPGCVFRVLPSLIPSVPVGPDGTASIQVPIAPSPSLVGLTFDAQWVVLVVPGLLAAASDSVRLLIGP